MLIKATLKDIETYGDFVYSLALDQSRSSYPAYSDGIKTKEDFLSNARRSVAREGWELLLFSLHGRVEGWVQYYWLPEDHYLQLCACNIRKGTAQALSELLARLYERFSGYTLYFGFPGGNEEAIAFLREKGFRCIEEDWNNTFFFEKYRLLPENGHVARIGRSNFCDFALIHRQDEENTYWNCDRILGQLEQWTIFVYHEGDAPVGTVFFQGDGGDHEIFGLEFAGQQYREETCRELLAAALNHCKSLGAKHMTFFCEEEVLTVVRELGFHCVGKYVLYIRTI